MIESWITILFLIVFSAVTLDLLGLFVSKFTRFRTWPPNKDSKFWYIELGITWTWTPGFFIVCILTYNEPSFPYLAIIPMAVIIFVVGLYFDIQGIRHLDSGYVKEGELTTTGIYSVTRNPQYVGSLLMGIGAVFISSSFYGFLLAFPAVAWFIIAPFVEEPLLLKQYGDKYREYCKKVPRFI